jgi:hypothetical protein
MGKLKETMIERSADDSKASTELSATGSNPWLQYGEAAGNHNFVGDLLKFTKGDFTAGQSNREVAIGTRLVANMDSLETGHVRWEDMRPVEHRMGRLVDGFKPAKRSELGHDDRSQWETDDDGQAPDPWQFSNQLELADPDKGELYTFCTSSKGGLTAIGELCKAYGAAMRQRPDDWPVVELGVGSYAHSNKAYGRIKYPTFEIVDWVPKDASPAPAVSAPTPPSPPPAKAAAKAARF